MSVVISASLVKELRERTGAAIMDCKHALVTAQGDIEAAIESMRVLGQAKAVKKASRVVAEGVVVIRHHAQLGVMLEVNCETDFVARDASFLDFTAKIIDLALKNEIDSIEALLSARFIAADGTVAESVEEVRQTLITKVGENIQLRRIALVRAEGVLGSYTHGGKIGVLVNLTGTDAVLARDLAMHIAALKPWVILPEQVSPQLVESERKVQVEKALESGKPQELVDKIIAGSMKKFLNEMSLIGQSFVKDPTLSVAQLLSKNGVQVIDFVRFEAAEGIEKKIDNFAEEVMAQVERS